MNVLIACEESQTVCRAFREYGHKAFSCDLQECSGGHPEWHVRGDALELINGDCSFITEDGSQHRPYLPSNTSGFRKGQKFSRGVAKNAKESSKTFPGVARAMAEQWGNL